MAQSVKHLTLAQFMISLFVSLSPKTGSVLTAQSLEQALDPVSPFLSALSPACVRALALSLSLPLSLSKINKHQKKKSKILQPLELRVLLIIHEHASNMYFSAFFS